MEIKNLLEVTPEMVKVSKIILKNLETLSMMVNKQDKTLGHVHAVCYTNRMTQNVIIFDHSDRQIEIDESGNVKIVIEDYHNLDTEIDSVDLFEENSDG